MTHFPCEDFDREDSHLTVENSPETSFPINSESKRENIVQSRESISGRGVRRGSPRSGIMGVKLDEKSKWMN